MKHLYLCLVLTLLGSNVQAETTLDKKANAKSCLQLMKTYYVGMTIHSTENAYRALDLAIERGCIELLDEPETIALFNNDAHLKKLHREYKLSTSLGN